MHLTAKRSHDRYWAIDYISKEEQKKLSRRTEPHHYRLQLVERLVVTCSIIATFYIVLLATTDASNWWFAVASILTVICVGTLRYSGAPERSRQLINREIKAGRLFSKRSIGYRMFVSGLSESELKRHKSAIDTALIRFYDYSQSSLNDFIDDDMSEYWFLLRRRTAQWQELKTTYLGGAASEIPDVVKRRDHIAEIEAQSLDRLSHKYAEYLQSAKRDVAYGERMQMRLRDVG